MEIRVFGFVFYKEEDSSDADFVIGQENKLNGYTEIKLSVHDAKALHEILKKELNIKDRPFILGE